MNDEVVLHLHQVDTANLKDFAAMQVNSDSEVLSSESSFDLTKQNKLRLAFFSNEFPPDDIQDLFRKLRVQSKSKDHLYLRLFLKEATESLRAEIRKLPSDLRCLIPPFESILDLAAFPQLRRGPLAGSIDGVMLLVVQIGLFIGHHECSNEKYDFASENSCLTGLGMGLVAAAAVAASTTISDLPRIGSEAIKIAMRMGVVVQNLSQNLESREMDAAPDSWAYVVIGLDEQAVQEELDSFNTSTQNPVPSIVFISAAEKTSVTVSGPPSKLRKLFRASEKLRYAKIIELPVYAGLCHAPHLYERSDAKAIIRSVELSVASRREGSIITLLSCSSGQQMSGRSPEEIFENVVAEIMRGTIRWNKVVEGLGDIVFNIQEQGCELYAFRTSHVVKDMISKLKSRMPQLAIDNVDLVAWITDMSNTATTADMADSKIAIIGMSCRYPSGANDSQLFWELLQEGRDVHQKIPADRYNVDSHTDPTGKQPNTSLTPFGCFIDQPGLFDAGFFNMSPREAAQTDPMHRLALVTAYEALEESGYVPRRTESTDLKGISTFYGQASDDYREVNSNQDIDTYYIPGGCRAFAPGRINYFFKFAGPSFSCDTACSSSLATLQIACTSLWSGDTNMVVAGGLNVLTNSDAFAGLSRGHFLSKTGSCKTWDCDADGYCRADGVGSLVMKRLEDAEADNDNILGVILSTATNHSADAISITHPHAGAQADLYQKVIGRAGVDAREVGFVEMHGTGTQAGDSVEIESITKVFAPDGKSSARRTEPLHIGAVKSNVGHGEAAAGITALIKVLLMFQNNAIPPHAGIKTAINPKFPDLEKLCVRIPYQKVPWERAAGKRRLAIVNNFSAAGGNTTMLLEEPPLRAKAVGDARTSFVVAISAKSKKSLTKNLASLLAYLENEPSTPLHDLAYTTTARRVHHNYRISAAGSSINEIVKGLSSHVGNKSVKSVPNEPPKIAFVFSGQGTFYANVGRQLYIDLPLFRNRIQELDLLVCRFGFPSFLTVIADDYPEDHVFRPVLTQLTIVCIGITLADLWTSLNVRPSVVIGASLGEYAALYAANVLSASDAIYLAGKRAQCLEAACKIGTHAMLAVRATVEQVKEQSDGKPYEIACINGKADICVSGSVEEICDLRESLETHGHKCHQLDVPFAFHSTQMDSILDDFESIGQGVVFKAPDVPIISPLLNDCVYDGKTVNATYMRRATREPVQFATAVEKAQEVGLVDDKTIWIDIGPHPICCNFIRSVVPSPSVTLGTLRRDEDNWRTLANTMNVLHSSGVELKWNVWHNDFENNLSLLKLPKYEWDDKNYWIQYNGNWSLTKDKAPSLEDGNAATVTSVHSTLRSSLVHKVVKEVMNEDSGEVHIRSDLMQSEFFEAANGHMMNGCAVVTSSIHADIAFTVAKYMCSKLRPGWKNAIMDMRDLEVIQGLVANQDKSKSQWIEVRAKAEFTANTINLEWYNVNEFDVTEALFATAHVVFNDKDVVLEQWSSTAHLISSRIDVLDKMAKDGDANSLSRNMAYTLFANLVDYAEPYRGMQSVVLNGMEASARVKLTGSKGGKYTIPPHHIDSVAHLAGFVLNGGDALDPKNNFFVTPGWKSMCFAKPLIPNGKYQSYVKMQAIPGQAGFFSGDVYVLEGAEVIGVVVGITFRTFPRVLLSKLFSPPDLKQKQQTVQMHAQVSASKISPAGESETPIPISTPARPAPQMPTMRSTTSMPPTQDTSSQQIQPLVKLNIEEPRAVSTVAEVDIPAPDANPAAPAPPPIVQQALDMIAKETAMDSSELVDDACFANLGVDSLLSLVLSERFRSDLGLEVSSSLFLECPTIGDLKDWLLG